MNIPQQFSFLAKVEGSDADSKMVVMRKHVQALAGKGYIWSVRGKLPDGLACRCGLYEWFIYDPKESGRLLAHYVGKTTGFGSRKGQYWRDMSAQLVEWYAGSRALKRGNQFREEASPLRWIHFWLAWAFVSGAQVVLKLRPCGNQACSHDVDEPKHIQQSMSCRLMNKERLHRCGLSADLIDMLGLLEKRSVCPCALPPSWAMDGARWMRAMRAYRSAFTRQSNARIKKHWDIGAARGVRLAVQPLDQG